MRSSPLRALLCALALLGAGCRAAAPEARTNHDALYRGAAAGGEYEVDPLTAALARRGPSPVAVPSAATEKPTSCQHDWAFMDRATHAYVDPATGFPALCTPRYCTKCGLVIHDCQNPKAR